MLQDAGWPLDPAGNLERKDTESDGQAGHQGRQGHNVGGKRCVTPHRFDHDEAGGRRGAGKEQEQHA